MANINKLTFTFVDGQTTINQNHLNSIVNTINQLIDAVGGATPTQQVAIPTISISGSTATISCSTSGATIRYAIDGTPTESSGTVIASGGTVALSSACTIRAIAYKSGMTTSQVAEQSYTPAATDISSLFTTWENGAIKWRDGGTQSSSAYERCALVDISAYAGKTFNYTRMVRENDTSDPVGLAFYDSSETYISGQGLHINGAEAGWEDYDVEIPSNAKYIRMTWYNATGSGAEWHDDFYAKIKG